MPVWLLLKRKEIWKVNVSFAIIHSLLKKFPFPLFCASCEVDQTAHHTQNDVLFSSRKDFFERNWKKKKKKNSIARQYFLQLRCPEERLALNYSHFANICCSIWSRLQKSLFTKLNNQHQVRYVYLLIQAYFRWIKLLTKFIFDDNLNLAIVVIDMPFNNAKDGINTLNMIMP